MQLYERLSNLRNEVGDSKLTARTQRLLMLGRDSKLTARTQRLLMIGRVSKLTARTPAATHAR